MIGVKKLLFKKNQGGFTLTEVLVSVSIFAVIILSATQIFKFVIDGQRSAIATQNVQESLKYFLEVVAKEIRMAQTNSDACSGIATNKIFATSTNGFGDVLKFKNYYGQCVTYFLATNGSTGIVRFKIQRDAVSDFISPQRIFVDDLNFALSDATNSQPVVTINLRAHALNEGVAKAEMTLQTSLTSRYYK
jgi:prepilin-type N-terminal cleavage/methylation domain-containing protein